MTRVEIKVRAEMDVSLFDDDAVYYLDGAVSGNSSTGVSVGAVHVYQGQSPIGGGPAQAPAISYTAGSVTIDNVDDPITFQSARYPQYSHNRAP